MNEYTQFGQLSDYNFPTLSIPEKMRAWVEQNDGVYKNSEIFWNKFHEELHIVCDFETSDMYRSLERKYYREIEKLIKGYEEKLGKIDSNYKRFQSDSFEQALKEAKKEIRKEVKKEMKKK